MNNKFLKYIFIGVLLLACGWYFFYAKPVPETKNKPEPLSAPHQTSLPPIQSSQSTDRSEPASEDKKAEAVMYHPKDIQEIKKQIYALNIESVEDIPLLDKVVQTGDAPTRDFWQGNWMSVDDNKQDINGFFLRPQEDGTFVFFPDEKTTRTYTFFETPKTYTYDAAKREFYWEINYYGKTISHRARFINDNVLAMMLISGNKVTLDLYAKGPADNK
jgi:hypothetical protein